jgi:hypothetical protein
MIFFPWTEKNIHVIIEIKMQIDKEKQWREKHEDEWEKKQIKHWQSYFRPLKTQQSQEFRYDHERRSHHKNKYPLKLRLD